MLYPPQKLNILPKLWCFVFFTQFWFLTNVWSQNALVRVGNPRKMNYNPDWDYGIQYTETQETKMLQVQFFCEIVLSVVFKYLQYIILIQHFVSYMVYITFSVFCPQAGDFNFYCKFWFLTRPCFRDSTENVGSQKMFVMARSRHQNILFGRIVILFAIYFIYKCKLHPTKSKENKYKNIKIVACRKTQQQLIRNKSRAYIINLDRDKFHFLSHMLVSKMIFYLW